MRLIDADLLLDSIKNDPFGGMNYRRYIAEAPNITIGELKEAADRLGYNLVKKPPKTGKKKPCPVCGKKPRIFYNYYTFGAYPNSSIEVGCPNECIPKIVSKRNVKCINANGIERIKRLPKYEVEAEATRLWNEEVEKYEREMGTDSV